MTKKRALEIIANFSHAGVLVVGDVMVDHFIWGNVSRISPEAPVPVVDVQKDSILLGGCANVLNNIYAIGGSCTDEKLTQKALSWKRDGRLL
jgi:D-beta-D-heptose 7-phosphate kinase/D-beta-D-heptose 1-phosphate adenosyltransferase